MSFYNYPMPYGYSGFGNYTSNINVDSAGHPIHPGNPGNPGNVANVDSRGSVGIGGVYSYKSIQTMAPEPEPVKFNFAFNIWLVKYLKHLIFLHDGCLIGPSAVNEYINRFRDDKIKKSYQKAKIRESILEIAITLSDFIKLANTINQNIQTYFNIHTNGPHYIDVKYPDVALLNTGSLDVHKFEHVEITFSRYDTPDKITLKSLIIISEHNHRDGYNGLNIPYGLYTWEHEYLMVYKSHCQIAKSILDRFANIRPLSPSQAIPKTEPRKSPEWFPPGIDITSTAKFIDQHQSYLTQITNIIMALYSKSQPDSPTSPTSPTSHISPKIKTLLQFVLYKENAIGFTDVWENIKAVMNDEPIGRDYLVEIRSNNADLRYNCWFAMGYFPDGVGLCANCGIRFGKDELYIIPNPDSGGSDYNDSRDNLFGYHRDCLARKWFYDCDELPYGIESNRDIGIGGNHGNHGIKCKKMWIPEWLFG